jgi:hypothetical protein
MSGYGEKRERLRRRTLALLALATAIGSAGLAAGGTAGALLAASVPTKLRPHVEGLGEVFLGLAAGAGAPVAGLVVAFGGFAALTLAGPWWRLRRFSLCSSFAGRHDGDRVSARCS